MHGTMIKIQMHGIIINLALKTPDIEAFYVECFKVLNGPTASEVDLSIIISRDLVH